MNLIRNIVFGLLQVASLTAICQKQNIRFDHIGTDQGLSQSNVICILQDSRGFMWFGTRDGLNKYDGYKFTVYKNDKHDPHSLGNNFIKALVETKNGDIWIATLGGGISRFKRERNQFTNFNHDPKNDYSISNDFTTSIMEDSRGNLWIGTEDGLNMYDRTKNRFTRYTNNKNDTNSLSDRYVRSIFEDSQHNLWIGTFSGGLNLFNPRNNTFTHFQHNDKNNKSLSCNSVYTMFEDSKHRFWIGTNGGGMNLFDKDKKEFYCYKHEDFKDNSLSGNTVYQINEDVENNLWIGTENGGLSIFNPETGLFRNYQNDEIDNTSLSNNSVYSIYKDDRNNVWLGTFNGGINLVSADRGKFIHYKHNLQKNSLSNNNILCIYEDSKKNIWIGTDGGGLNLFDPKNGNFTQFHHEKNNKNSICGEYVLSVCEDSKENLWIGTWADGITLFDQSKQTFRHFKNEPGNASSLSNNNAWKIFEDREKNIWVCTYGGGLNLFDPQKNSFVRYQHENNNNSSLSNDNVYSILEDSEGKFWISTDGGGLNLFDKKTKTFTHFLHDDKKNSISDNSVGSIYEDRNKDLWIGTMAGLSFLDRKTNRFTNYTTANGLPNDVIFGILEDGAGNLWISTNKGISKFNPLSKQFKNFTPADGLQSNEFKQQAYCKGYDGTMYFGGTNGFNQFLPYEIKVKSFDPSLVITSFQIFGSDVPISNDTIASPLKKDISETDEVTIPYKSSVISFEFASLNYGARGKRQYEYMLEGFDQKWTNIGTRRLATYTNLDAGKYTFKVKTLNNDGEWSQKTAEIKLTITPPFWKTWWFRSLVILFILGCFIAFYTLRMRTITNQKKQLEIVVEKRTEEIVLQREELKKNVQELAALKDSLEEEKYLLDSLMDHMPDSIYFKDKESKLTRVSKYMAERFGSTVEGLIGKSDFDFQDLTHATEAYNDEQEIQKNRKPKIDYVEKEVRGDGTELWVSTTKMPLINARGEVVGTFGISRDITALKTLEQEQHLAEIDKAVAQGKFEIASDVMHDIGNAVVGFGSYLTRIRRLQEQDSPENLQNLAGFFEDQKTGIAATVGEAKADAVIKMLYGIAQTQKKNQEEIGKSIREQLNIISHIQEILNIQRQYISGHESQERKPVNLRNIINDSLSMLFASIDKIGIAVSLNIEMEKPIIKGDRTKLMQLMLNILKNSIEAIDKDATEKTIVVSAYSYANRLVVQLKDSGNGFDKATGSQLFEKGFSTKHSSSGIGLYNCLSIVESHEGTIDITSEGPGMGALTTISFGLEAPEIIPALQNGKRKHV
jgi:PAS domain S-box-containing protein